MEEKTSSAQPASRGVIESLWRFFTSTMLAFVLIIVIALLGLVGALVTQYTGDKALYQSWLENTANHQYGLWTPMMALLQLFRVFHSIWFLGAGVLLVVNILVCSLNRWERVSHALRGGLIVHADSYYQDGVGRAEITLNDELPEKAMDSVVRSLKTQGFRVRKELSGDKVYVAADKNRYFRLGTYLTHFSLILFILGFLISGAFGFRNNSFDVRVGAIENVGDNSALSLKLISFKDEYYPEGPPKDYRSEVVLYENGKQVKQGTIQVNHPLVYKGYSFYQSSFGQSVLVQVKDNSGKTLVDSSIALNEPVQTGTLNLISGGIQIPQTGLELWAFKAGPGGNGTMANQSDLIVQIIDQSSGQVIKMGRIPSGTPTILNNLEITYKGDSRFSGFQVTRDPGTNFIWAASILLLAGLVTVFYFPLRQIWAVAIPGEAKTSLVLFRINNSRSYNASADLDRFVKTLESGQTKK